MFGSVKAKLWDAVLVSRGEKWRESGVKERKEEQEEERRLGSRGRQR